MEPAAAKSVDLLSKHVIESFSLVNIQTMDGYIRKGSVGYSNS